ncbi:MAG: hypothetical protein RL189_967 [Pseudomonadota bacterium]|jgi:hypothetical protein
MNTFSLTLILSFAMTQVVACTGKSRQEAQVEAPRQPEQNVGQQDGESAANEAAPTGDSPRSDNSPSTPADPASGSAETPQPKPAVPSPEALGLLQQRYNSELNSIIDSRCQICHGSENELNFSDFERVKAYAVQMEDAVSKGRMPFDPSGLPNDEKVKLIDFLNELAKLSR